MIFLTWIYLQALIKLFLPVCLYLSFFVYNYDAWIQTLNNVSNIPRLLSFDCEILSFFEVMNITLGESSSRQNREPEASPGQKEVI